MLSLKYKPIVEWPGELTNQKAQKTTPFKSHWGRTLNLLERELRHLQARNLIVQVAVDERDIRIDGGLKSGRLMYHSGVILSFDSRHGPLSYWTDKYDEFAANLRAIALALEALRAIGRYGVNQQGSQYEGYKRLNAAPAENNGRPKIETPEQAAELVASHLPGVTADQLLSHGYLVETLCRQASRTLHPDNKETGDEAKFVELQEAAVLRKHHGL